jgi:hypothetical protein
VARYEASRTYSNSADDCFAAIQAALPAAGFAVWKTRPIAWLALGKRSAAEDTISANMSARPGGRVTLAMSGEHTSEEVISSLAQQVWAALEARLRA